jgi:putative SOS response-associated peptidase YedK
MCGRYIEVQKVEVIEKRFNVRAPEDIGYHPGYNISPGKKAPVITSEKPDQLQMYQFGLTPFWSKKPMYLFNARAEGDKNKENDPTYAGASEIIRKPAFRKPMRSQRCLVIADAFIEGTTEEGLNKPYVIYLKNRKRPFAFAGIWDRWENKEKGTYLDTFAIITTVANELIRKLPHHRSPVILPEGEERRWLNTEAPVNEVLDLLQPYPAEEMNAYPISKQIKNPKADGRELLEPIGERIESESDFQIRKDLHLRGMGNPRKK